MRSASVHSEKKPSRNKRRSRSPIKDASFRSSMRSSRKSMQFDTSMKTEQKAVESDLLEVDQPPKAS